MITVTVSEEFKASPAAVWAVLTDFHAYEGWHPFARIDGIPVAGSKVDLMLSASDWRKAKTLSAKIEGLTERETLAIRFGYRYIGLVQSFHVLEALPGGTRLTHTVILSGLLPILRRSGLEDWLKQMLQLPMRALSRHVAFLSKRGGGDSQVSPTSETLSTNRKGRRQRASHRSARGASCRNK